MKKRLLKVTLGATLALTIAFPQAAFADVTPVVVAVPGAPTVASSQGQEKIVTTGTLNVRAGAGISHGVIGSLKQGDRIVVLSEANGWSEINFNGRTAYVATSYLATVRTSSNAVIATAQISVPTVTVKATPDANASVVARYAKGDTAYIVAELPNNWFEVKFNNNFGFVHANDLVDPIIQKLTINVASVNVRATASEDARVIANFVKDDVVHVVRGGSENWIRVEFNNQTGFINADDLHDPANRNVIDRVTIPVDRVNVRSASNSNARIVATYAKGDVANIIPGGRENWFKVLFIGGNTGFINANDLVVPTVASNTVVDTIKVEAENVNIRESANANARAIAKYAKGDTAYVLAYVHGGADTWALVSVFDGRVGFVNVADLSE